MESDPDSIIKLAVVGSGGVGKSALAVQFTQELFQEDYDPTIQDNYRKRALIDGDFIDLDILDTAGQDEFTSLREMYMKSQDGFLLCFSLASRAAFNQVPEFHKQIIRSKAPPGTIDLSTVHVPIVLVGNKSDIPESNRQVTQQDMHVMAQQLNISKFVLTSAKECINVTSVFEDLATEIYQHRKLTRREQISREIQSNNSRNYGNDGKGGCRPCGVRCTIA